MGEQVARGGRERDQLREKLLQENCTTEQIAAAMARQFGDRPRAAWRHAYGWAQQDVADRYNQLVKDKQNSMAAHRISDFERWPINGTGVKPTVPTLGVLAKIYATKVSKLIDRHDRQKMNNAELITCAIVDSGVIPQQLPSTISNFVGRTHELDILTTQLDRVAVDGSTVIITSIGGTAGIGKTTLALYWTRKYIDQFPDGQLYVDLRGFSPSGTPVTPQEAIRGFLDAFQVPPEKIPVNPDDQAALYRTLVEDRQLVIVLDNARNADQVRPLLPESPTCLVLVTSRQQLGSLIARERAMYITLDFLAIDEARQLLADFLGVERMQAEPEAVNELIHRCVHLPIALTIAAARILTNPHLPLSVLVGELREERQRLAALATGDSQETDIRAVFSWSYTALSPQVARLFRLLGLHSGPDIDVYAAASLASLPVQGAHEFLTELTRACLLDQHIPGRYQFHDLLRAYATEQAATEEPEQQRAASFRVLDYYLHTSVVAVRRIDPIRETQDSITLEAPQPGTIPCQITDYEQAVNWFASEHAVLLAAIDHAVTCGFDVYAWQLPWALVTFLNQRGHWHDYVTTQRIALAATDRLGDRNAQAIIYRFLGSAHTRLKLYTDALVYFHQSLTLYQGLGDLNGQAHAHIAFSWTCEQQGQYSQVLPHAQYALDLFRATKNYAGQAYALDCLGWAHAQLGNNQQALTYCQQALSLQRELGGDRYGEANTLDSLGYAHHQLGQHTQAITYYQQSIALWRELGNRYDVADVLSRLGDTYHVTGKVTNARQFWQQALTILDQLAHRDADTIRAKLATLDNDPDTGVTSN